MDNFHYNNLVNHAMVSLHPYLRENSVSIKLLWAKLALVVEFFSPFRDIAHSENKSDSRLLTKHGVSVVLPL